MGILCPEAEAEGRRAKRISAAHRAENAPRADQNVIVMGILCPEGRRAKRVSAADRAENAPRADQNVLL